MSYLASNSPWQWNRVWLFFLWTSQIMEDSTKNNISNTCPIFWKCLLQACVSVCEEQFIFLPQAGSVQTRCRAATNYFAFSSGLVNEIEGHCGHDPWLTCLLLSSKLGNTWGIHWFICFCIHLFGNTEFLLYQTQFLMLVIQKTKHMKLPPLWSFYSNAG